MSTDAHLEELLDEALECLDAGRNEEARAFAAQATQHAPDDPEGWEYLGTALWRLGNIREAADAFRRWRDLAPLSRAAHRSLAGAFFRLGMYEQVEEACSTMSKQWPNDPYCIVLLANARYKQGREYRDILDRAFDRDPQSAGEMLTKLFDFRRLERPADAPITADEAAPIVGLSVADILELAEEHLIPHRTLEDGQPLFYEAEITAWRDTLSWYGLFPPRTTRRPKRRD